MSFKSQLTLDSRFFNPAERRKAFGEAAYSSAQTFRRDLQQKMIDSTPTGRDRNSRTRDEFRRAVSAFKARAASGDSIQKASQFSPGI